MKKLFVFILLAALVICLTACPAKQTANSASDYEYVKGKGEIIIGYTVYAPMNFTDDNGVFTGFDTELAIAVCSKLQIKPNFVEINWDTKEVELNAKTIDCIWNGLTITPARQETMAITNPYIQNAQVVVVKSDAAYSGTASLIGKTVCAEAGSAGEESIEGDENLLQAHYVAKEVQTACLMEVAAGTADAAVLDLTLAKAMIGPGTDYANLTIVDHLDIEDYGIAFRKGSDLCDKVNGVLKDLRTDGTLPALAEKYGLDMSN
ncbi:MAG: transporter substrate-binding domain-containing protein [Firmicutes bacterium]|nr:transporter substrate-binding domain-containing protein [Bacillota bacterium]